MPKKFLKKHMPDAEKLKHHKNLQFLGERLHEPNLWHLNRRSVALAFAVGLFCAWIPTPGQMAIAALGAFYFKANLPISVGLVWITNPVTMPLLFYFSYRVGLWVMNRPSPADDFQFSVEGVFNGLGDIWEPFLLGCFIVGVISAVAGYFGIHYIWQKNVAHKWWLRQQNRMGIEIASGTNLLHKAWIWLQSWFSPGPTSLNTIQPSATKKPFATKPNQSQRKAILQTYLKRILDFVPFN